MLGSVILGGVACVLMGIALVASVFLFARYEDDRNFEDFYDIRPID